MPATRPRRIVGRAVIVLSVVLLLLASYVSSWLCFNWLKGRGNISASASTTLTRTVYAPMVGYMTGEMPGHEVLWRATLWCRFRGNTPWDELPPFPRRKPKTQTHFAGSQS